MISEQKFPGTNRDTIFRPRLRPVEVCAIRQGPAVGHAKISCGLGLPSSVQLYLICSLRDLRVHHVDTLHRRPGPVPLARSFRLIILAVSIDWIDHHVPAHPEATPLSDRARRAQAFRPRRRRLLRLAIDPERRSAGAGNPARRLPGRAQQPLGGLHRAGARDRRPGPHRAARGAGAGGARRRAKEPLVRRVQARRHPDHRPIPAAQGAAEAPQGLSEAEALSQRGPDPAAGR